MTDPAPTWADLRRWSREQLEAALATAQMEAMHARSKALRDWHGRRVRRLREVLEGMTRD